MTDMDNSKLEKWAEQLLDTGKKNNLISFRDTKSSTAEILIPSSHELFAKIEGGTSFEVFDPKIQEDDVYDTRRITDRELFYETYAAKIKKKSQLLVFSAGGNPIAALRTIERKAREYLDETGVNVAYIAFGFIHWKESEHSEIENLAPILLVPVNLSRESAISPYHIRSEDADIVVNPTFSYKLAAEFGVKLPPYNDEGLEDYLTSVSDLMKKLGWTVSGEAKIGIFSFLKINMYQDLIENEAKILSNNNVRLLLMEPLLEEENNASSPKEAEEEIHNPLVELHSVVDADSSQIEAIELARKGKSFVLQGPPGTGKSQTITNIIAECLFDGKKVLFVSEKLAALNVVYDKLRQAGLEDFCLELHSHKSSKRTIIDNLCRTLHTNASYVSSKAEAEISEKIRTQKQLDDYAFELHAKREGVNKSLYQLFERYSSLRQIPDVKWSFSNIASRDEAYFKKAEELLKQYEAFLPSIGYDYRNNVWYGYIRQAPTYETKLAAENQLKKSDTLIAGLLLIERKIRDDCHTGPLTVNGLYVWNKLLACLSGRTILCPALFYPAKFNEREEIFRVLADKSRTILKLREELSSEYDSSIFRQNGDDLYNRLTKLYGSFFSRILNQDYWKIIDQLRLCHKYGKKLSYEEAVDITRTLMNLQQAEQTFKIREEQILGAVGEAYQSENTDWNTVLNELDVLKEMLSSRTDLGTIAQMDESEFRAFRDNAPSLHSQLDNVFHDLLSALKEFSDSFDPAKTDFMNMPLEAAQARLLACMHEAGRIENYCQFRTVLYQLAALDCESFIHTAIRQNLPAEVYAEAFAKRYYDQWISCIIASVPLLSQFSRIRQDAFRIAFAEKDREQFDINKAMIRSVLSQKRPVLDMVTPGSPVYILQREGEKKRKQKSIRALLTEIGPLVQTLKPCFLMSPLSVSTFLNPDTVHFDTVIFDEASQVFPQDAIGAIYRGNQVIVVGDSKQMPPSNFFNAMVDDLDAYDEDSDVTDFESILDLCSASMKQLRLKWHYRSRYEQLIHFSNLNFYDGELVTFPSCIPDQKGIGIDYYHTDGLFDRKSHTNRKEAEYIVDLIYQNFELYPKRSLGVVAFSVAQQELIDHLLNRRRQETPEKEAFFRNDVREPFFIKNLETVQGDERDTIIFSVAYGKDFQGKLKHNFGPLNREGGERRLNVAITRAKCNVQIVSSMHSADIDLSRSQSRGVRLLKEYLDYAENGEIALQRALDLPKFDSYDSDFEMEVAEFLRSEGYTADTQVGCSGFRIDIGLRRPDSSDYVLAVECDGATYHSSRNARDRDRLRQEVLERMGWKFYRIWSTDWFRNKKTEKERLLEAVKLALSNTGSGEEPKKSRPDDFENTAERHLRFQSYEPADIAALSKEAGGDYKYLVSRILEIESPLSEEWLLKRTCAFFNREKVTSAVKKEYEHAMIGCEDYGIQRNNGFLYKKGQKQILFRSPGILPRDVKYISPEELASGILTILSQNSYAEKDGLYKTLAEYCGLKRLGNSVIPSFDGAVNFLKDHGYVTVENNQISLKH